MNHPVTVLACTALLPGDWQKYVEHYFDTTIVE